MFARMCALTLSLSAAACVAAPVPYGAGNVTVGGAYSAPIGLPPIAAPFAAPLPRYAPPVAYPTVPGGAFYPPWRGPALYSGYGPWGHPNDWRRY